MAAIGQIKIIGHNPRICFYDNGTTVCDKNHKIGNYGICVSQSIGTVNSTSEFFQPDYSICSNDYSATYSSGSSILCRGFSVEGSTYQISYGSRESGDYIEIRESGATSLDWVALKSLVLSSNANSIVVWSNSIAGNTYAYLEADAIVGRQNFLQLDSGWILRGEEVTSDYFVYDIFSMAVILQPYMLMPKISTLYTIASSGPVESSHWQIIEPYKGTINNPSSELYENPVEICVGDLSKPTLENISPIQYSELNSFGDIIEFDIVDAIGGVEKSSVYITVSGNLSTQPEGINIVEAGVSSTPQASFDGYAGRYSFTYIPTNDWEQNETVSITVTGTDIVPISPQTGAAFSCYTGDPNPFGYDWTYQVRAQSSMGATIVAVADSESPYLENIYPTPYFGHLASESFISFNIKDDLAGVDIDTLSIYIDDVPVVSYGLPLGSNITISGDKNNYNFLYTNLVGFGYGSRVNVRVVVSDLYAVSPNTLDYSYYFDVVDDSTVRFENFYPSVGITWNPEAVDIEVDVIDSVYDIDVSDLYLSINGNVVPAFSSPIYGIRNIIATLSGVVDSDNGHLPVSGLSLLGTCISGASFSGVSTDGAYISGGQVIDGFAYGTSVSGYPIPYDESGPDYLISSYVSDGYVVSGTLQTALVSGTNWDGKYTNSTITGVEVCPIYASDVTASGVSVSGTVGRNLSYHPPNDFNYEGTISVLVHGTNLSSSSPITREVVYQLFHGYNIKAFDREFGYSSRVNVYIEAHNTKEFTNHVSQGYYFDTIDEPSCDMSASIVGIAPWEDLAASINPQAPVHKYGKTMEVQIYVEDEEGNALGPYTYTYTIEDSP